MSVQNSKEIHGKCHCEVDKTLCLARLLDEEVSREEIEECVKSCNKCQSLDPAPMRIEKGCLGVTENGCRLAADVTHFGREIFVRG